MGEGLGGWGHATRRVRTIPETRPRPTPAQFFSSFFSCWVAAVSASAGADAGLRPCRQIGRQINLAAIRKFQISQADMAPAAFDHVAGADREPARQTNDLATHASLLLNATAATIVHARRANSVTKE